MIENQWFKLTFSHKIPPTEIVYTVEINEAVGFWRSAKDKKKYQR